METWRPASLEPCREMMRWTHFERREGRPGLLRGEMRTRSGRWLRARWWAAVGAVGVAAVILAASFGGEATAGERNAPGNPIDRFLRRPLADAGA
jgi:hypothetical protein